MSAIKSRTAALLALALGTWVGVQASAADSTARPRAALVIGNAAYSAVNPLKNPSYDAHDMCDALTELGYTASCFVDIKDSREFKARIQDFAASLKPKSEVLFYYAGHAVQVRGENYLVPTSAKLRAEADVARETVSLNYIMTQLLQAKHYLNIVILDACRSNPWSDNPHGMISGLAPITAIPRGTMVMYATATNDVSDDGEGRNGTLTKSLLANVKTPGLTVDEVFKRVSEGVQADSAAAVGHTQTPALYTNFTGEFCFAGCIDKVARAELDKMQKANEEQLEKARREKAELEAHNREMEAKLAATVTSMNCDKSVLNDSGQCFTAAPEQTLRAVTTTLLQRGFRITSSSVDGGYVEGMRSVDNAQDRKLTDVLTAIANVREIPVTGHSIVTITATQRTVLHDEFHKWGQLGIIPIPTSKEYKDVVKKEVNVTDAAFYSDVFAAVERNLRSEGAAVPTEAASAQAAPVSATTDSPGATSASESSTERPHAVAGAADTADGTVRAVPVSLQNTSQIPMQSVGEDRSISSSNQQTYGASAVETERALIEALVQRGFVVESVNPDLGIINAMRKVQDPKDERYSTNTALSASVMPNSSAGGARVQMTASEQRVLHRKPGSRVAGFAFGYQPHDYQTVVTKETSVNDSNFYRDLFVAVDTNLHGGDAPKMSHLQHFAADDEQVLTAAIDGLAQRGYTVTHSDKKLRFVTASRRTTRNSKEKDGWVADYVNTTLYVRSGSDGQSVLVAAATEQEAGFRMSVRYAFSNQQLQAMTAAQMDSSGCTVGVCSPVQQIAAMMATISGPQGYEIVRREGEASAAFFSDIFKGIGEKLASMPTPKASAIPTAAATSQ
jgi:uncharacterized caspase-like protein